MQQTVEGQRWLQALLHWEQGSRLNQMLSIMSGGAIQYVQWLYPLQSGGYAIPDNGEEFLQQMLRQEQVDSQWPTMSMNWNGAGILHSQDGQVGLLVVAAFATQSDFDQEQLQQQLSWLRQMQQLNGFPVRLLLLAFSNDSNRTEPQQGLLEDWQWEELLTTGVQMAVGQSVALSEVIILPMVAYRSWLQKLEQSEQKMK